MLIGAHGTGKTSLLVEMMTDSIARRHGVCFFDAHGLTLPGTLIDPATKRWNPLREPIEPALAATLFQGTTKSAWDYAGMTTPTMDMFLLFSAAALIENARNLSDILKLLTDRQYRSTLYYSDEVTAKFWADFEDLNPAQQRQEVSSTLNKFYSLLSDPRIRRMLSVNKKGICLSDFLDDQVLHVRLPVRLYGKAKAKLIGSLILSYLTQLLLERNDPRPYDIYIDDAHLYAHDTVHNTLVSSSRYGLSATVAIQNSKQLDPGLFDALLGNTDAQYLFRVSREDADVLSPHMPPNHSKVSLDRLPNHSYREIPFDKLRPDGVTIPLEI
ncbi:type IV secretory system conjugative DNA transfer family protein [Dinoroseobacter sp. S76]|uniref:type IV secretory system conjugative DNA transfer family protein n=1 Tax=Dinoroseobacter sp. S76 TaxID=3415124 RepID=UPI003C7C47F1